MIRTWAIFLYAKAILSDEAMIAHALSKSVRKWQSPFLQKNGTFYTGIPVICISFVIPQKWFFFTQRFVTPGYEVAQILPKVYIRRGGVDENYIRKLDHNNTHLIYHSIIQI